MSRLPRSDSPCTIVFAVGSAIAWHIATPALAQEAPYPPSPVIQRITWDWDTLKQAAPGSDLWPITWASDGHLYAAWGDGGDFGGTNSDGRVSMGFARIGGPPEASVAANVNGGKRPENPTSFPDQGKTGGIVWSADVDRPQPIFTDPNGGIGSITYVAELQRYTAAGYHGGPDKLGIFDAPEPWGPWATVAYYEGWGNMGPEGHGLTYSFPSK